MMMDPIHERKRGTFEYYARGIFRDNVYSRTPRYDLRVNGKHYVSRIGRSVSYSKIEDSSHHTRGNDKTER